MIINAVAFKFFVPKRQRSLPCRSEINRRIVFVCDDFRENPADLQPGGLFTSGSIIAFDRFVDAFESANPECHLAGKFFQHVL